MNTYIQDVLRITDSVPNPTVTLTKGQYWHERVQGIHREQQRIMVEARGSDGTYVRGFTTAILGDK